MQPTYLPWVGYFDLMDAVEMFVFLDDVPFSKQSWQQRNRIKGRAGLLWMTVPVLHKGRSGQSINATEIRYPEFWRKHVRAIEMSYAAAPHLGRLLPELREVYEQGSPWGSLAGLNISLIQWMDGNGRCRITFHLERHHHQMLLAEIHCPGNRNLIARRGVPEDSFGLSDNLSWQRFIHLTQLEPLS